MISKTILLLLFAYFCGSLPWGVIFTRLFSAVDVRAEGSKNIGANNVYRLAGKKLGLLTLSGDLLKGAVPVIVATLWLDASGWKGEVLVCLVALSAFAGHLFSIFLGFRGGKGVATAAGGFLALSPMSLLVCFLVYVLVVCWTGYSSAGSLSASAVLPGAVWLATHSIPLLLCALVMAVAIYVRHADNIKRLIKRTEYSPLRRER